MTHPPPLLTVPVLLEQERQARLERAASLRREADRLEAAPPKPPFEVDADDVMNVPGGLGIWLVPPWLCAHANTLGRPVRCVFNDHTYTAFPGETLQQVQDRISAALHGRG